MNRHRALAENATAAAAQVGDTEVGYFVRLLSQIRRRTNLRIDMYQRGIALADARGDVGYACAFKHLTHIELRDREILEGLIDGLQRRLSPPNEAIAPISREAQQ
jgi:hypothetical protein